MLRRFFRGDWLARVWDGLAICGMAVCGAALTALYMIALAASVWTF